MRPRVVAYHLFAAAALLAILGAFKSARGDVVQGFTLLLVAYRGVRVRVVSDPWRTI